MEFRTVYFNECQLFQTLHGCNDFNNFYIAPVWQTSANPEDCIITRSLQPSVNENVERVRRLVSPHTQKIKKPIESILD